MNNRWLPWILLAPALILILALTIYPLFNTVYLSFRQYDMYSLMTGVSTWVGLSNYTETLTDPFFWTVTRNTVVFGMACVFGTMIAGLLVALLLNTKFKGSKILGIVILIPWVFPAVAGGIVWRWMFNDQYGVANYLLTQIGLTRFDGFAWFNSPWTAFTVIFFMIVWQSFPFIAVSLLAGFQTIPDTLYEAAEIDGANAWHKVTKITLPMLKPLLLILFILSTIWDFKIFDQIYVMTEGGPARGTYVLALYSWSEAFNSLNFGMASAIAMLMFVLLMFFIVIYIYFLREEKGGKRA
ncbi:ABC transporter permease [Alteribacter lacisalsi]|uniref:ABC transporter permease n=1 Tax=Alteribacter lacisalsi TaxID=2045244 RepID=A0A2W0H8H0_9BACI|nr:sugar ABC transporter permease [Alteribacter lacisalsi]PYZ96380.1 ABC transporter permease [Alteribacter lacisalsi]